MKVSKRRLKRFYEGEAKFKKYLPKEDYLEEIRVRLVNSLIPSSIESVLDVGCGDGYLSFLLSQKNKKVFGLDLSEVRIKRAKSKFKSVDFRVGDATALPYPKDSFDITIASEVLEHVPNFEKVIREMKRVSKKYILFTVPYKEKLTEVLCPHCLKKFYLSGHIHHFDEGIIEKIAKNNNLRIVKVKKISAFPYTVFKTYHSFLKNMMNWLLVKVSAAYIGALLEIRD